MPCYYIEEEEPIYYAKIKGSELIDNDRIYWLVDIQDSTLHIGELPKVTIEFNGENKYMKELVMSKGTWRSVRDKLPALRNNSYSIHIDEGYKEVMTKEEWRLLGINDTNAEFEEVGLGGTRNH